MSKNSAKSANTFADAADVVDSDAAADDVVDTVKKVPTKRRWRRGTVALRDIRKQQQSTAAATRMAPYERIVREIAQEFAVNDKDFRFTARAMRLMQEASEMNLYNVFRRSYAVTLYGGRVQMDAKDIALADYVAGESNEFVLRQQGN